MLCCGVWVPAFAGTTAESQLPHFASLNAGYVVDALHPAAPRLARRHNAAEDRRINRAGGVLDVLRQQRARPLAVARQRRLHDRHMLAAQAAPRDRAPQHGAVAIALRLVVEELGEAQ